MIQVLSHSWALLLGVMLLMVGNGIQGTLLGLRGSLEGFTAFQMSIVMAGYFAGFLGGSRMAPWMIRRVGHVRVFAALGSFISAVLILYPVAAHPVAWTLLRVAIGFSFSGVYVTAESWLNNAATNETRGKALSLYLIVQMIGIIGAQGLVMLADPGGFVLFILPSVLVSLAFAPILLSVSPTPAFAATRPMSLKELYTISPLGVVGIFLMGAVFSAQFGMAAVYGTEAGLSVGKLTTFVSAFYVGGLILQYPIGWVSDRVDRRGLIIAVAALGMVAAVVPIVFAGSYSALLIAAALIGGSTNPLYALLLAYTNDFLEVDDMPSASAGLMFVNGVGAIAGPILTGYAMAVMGPNGYFVYIGVGLVLVVAYGFWRMTQRAAPEGMETQHYAAVLPQASPVAVEMSQELYAEAVEDAAEEGISDTDGRPSAQ